MVKQETFFSNLHFFSKRGRHLQILLNIFLNVLVVTTGENGIVINMLFNQHSNKDTTAVYNHCEKSNQLTRVSILCYLGLASYILTHFFFHF